MKLYTAAYDSATTDTHKTLTEETNLLYYTINHDFNEPANCTIVLNDPTGALIHKYRSISSDTDDVFIGPGRVWLEDPTLTCIFDGRIIKARHDSTTHTLVLYCEDWLSQLNEHRINYDMREDLDGAGLMESVITPHPEDADSLVYPVYHTGNYDYLWDATQDWTVDQWEGYRLVFPSSMAGTVTQITGPYTESVAPAVDDDGPIANGALRLWRKNRDPLSMYHHYMHEHNDDFIATYSFRVYGILSDIQSAKVNLYYTYWDDSKTDIEVYIYDYNLDQYARLGSLSVNPSNYSYNVVSFNVPEGALPYIVEGDIALVAFSVTVDAGGGTPVFFELGHLSLEIVANMTGTSFSVDIVDNTAVKLKVEGETISEILTGSKCLWANCPYSIIDHLYKRVDLLLHSSEPLMPFLHNIEATGGFSSRVYKERTVLEILQDLAIQDCAQFWLPLGGNAATTTTFQWNKSFGAAATAWTDASVLKWSGGEYDYLPIRNEYHIYGMRIGSSELYVDTSDVSDPGANSKHFFGVTRSETLMNSGLSSERDAKALGDALVTEQDGYTLGYPIVFPQAILFGLSSVRLGDVINLTSSVLFNGSLYKFVVDHWSYDSRSHRTTIRLAPWSSAGLLQHKELGEIFKENRSMLKLNRIDTYVPLPI